MFVTQVNLGLQSSSGLLSCSFDHYVVLVLFSGTSSYTPILPEWQSELALMLADTPSAHYYKMFQLFPNRMHINMFQCVCSLISVRMQSILKYSKHLTIVNGGSTMEIIGEGVNDSMRSQVNEQDLCDCEGLSGGSVVGNR